jgi:hypothetical protein
MDPLHTHSSDDICNDTAEIIKGKCPQLGHMMERYPSKRVHCIEEKHHLSHFNIFPDANVSSSILDPSYNNATYRVSKKRSNIGHE